MIVGQDDRILGMFLPYDIRFPVEQEVLLVASEPGSWIGCPAKVNAVGRSMVPAVDDGDRASLFAEVHLAVAAFNKEITINEHRSGAKGAPERFLTIEVEVAVSVGGRAVESIVSTFKMTVFIVRVSCSVQRIEVQTADEAYFLGYQTVAVDVADMRLCNGIAAFGAV